jgi:hypothetical protein
MQAGKEGNYLYEFILLFTEDILKVGLAYPSTQSNVVYGRNAFVHSQNCRFANPNSAPVCRMRMNTRAVKSHVNQEGGATLVTSGVIY